MSRETELEAEIADLKEKVKALTTLVGQSGGSVSRFNIATDKLLGPFGALVDATASGATGLSIYNNFLDKNIEIVEKFFGSLGPLGDAIKGIAGVSTGFVKMVASQNDALYKTYQGISSVGAAGEADLDNIMKVAKQFGITNAQELPKFNQMIAQSSETLAHYGTTVASGLKQFGEITDNIQRSGAQTEFMNMGMSVDAINKGLAGYLKIQTMTGAAQKMTTEQLTAGAENYIRELDILSKLTGKSSEAIQKEREERLLNEQYSIHQRELQQAVLRGGEEGLAAQKKLDEEDKVLAQTSGEARKGFMAAFTGYGMQFEEGRKLYMSAPEAFRMAAEKTGGQAAQILDSAKTEFGKTMDTFGSLIMAAGNKLFVNVSDMRFTEGTQGKAKDREDEAREQQRKQTQATNETVGAMTATIQMQRQATISLTNMLQTAGLAVSYFGMKVAEAQRAQAGKLPGAAEPTKGMSSDEIAKELAKQVEQLRTQGIGGAPGSPATDRGVVPTEWQIEKRALEDLQKILPEVRTFINNTIAELQRDLTNAGSDAARATAAALIEQYKKALEKLNLVPAAAPAGAAAPASSSSGATAALLSSQVLSANISRGVINVASMDNVKFPTMMSRFSGAIDNVDAKQLMATKLEASNSVNKMEKSSDSELIASNTMLSGKMDELIGLMRTSNGYQQKISQQVYA